MRKKCPICGDVYELNQCPTCGYDETCDAERKRTLVKLPYSIKSTQARSRMYQDIINEMKAQEAKPESAKPESVKPKTAKPEFAKPKPAKPEPETPKRNTKKIVFIVAAILMLIALVNSIGAAVSHKNAVTTTASSKNSTTTAETKADTVKETKTGEISTAGGDDYDLVMDRGVLKVGVDPYYPPYAYLDEDGNFAGSDVDFMKAFGIWLNIDIEFVNMNWDEKDSLLDAYEIDCICSGLEYAQDRGYIMDMSHPYAENKYVFVVIPDRDDSIDPLAGLTVAVMSESEEMYLLEGLAEIYGYSEYSKEEDVLNAVRTGQCDCALVLESTAKDLVESDPDFKITGNLEPIEGAKMVIGFRKGSSITDYMNAYIDSCN